MKIAALFAQIHTSVLIQLSEVWIPEVFYKTDSFTGRLHFGAKLPADAREFFKTKYWLFDSKATKLFFKLEVLQFLFTQHDLCRNIEIRDLVGFRNEWCCS